MLEIDLLNVEYKNNCVKEELLRLSLIILPPSAEVQKSIALFSALSPSKFRDRV